MEHEIHRFKNLTYDELQHLKSIYTKRISEINKQILKFFNGEELGMKTYSIIKSYGYKSKLLKDESLIISEKISKIWKFIGGNISYNILSYVLASCILEKYDYEFNPYIILEEDDINITQYYRLYLKIFKWLNENYWKK